MSPHRTPRPSASTPLGAGRRARRSLVLVALGAVGVLGTAAPASATNEFPSKPTASASLACVPGDPVGGPELTVVLGNVGGLSSAHFEVSRTGVATAAYDVAQGETITKVSGDLLGENTDTTVTITSDDGFTYTEAFHVDCTGFVGGVVLTCDGLQPELTANATAIGELGDEVFFSVDGDEVATQHLEPGESASFVVPVANDVAFTSSLDSDADGTLSDLVGTPHCALPPTSTTTTVPAPPTTTTVSAPPTTTPTTPITSPATVLPRQVDAPPVAPTELARTGTSTLPLALLGATLVAVGLLLRRHAATRTA